MILLCSLDFFAPPIIKLYLFPLSVPLLILFIVTTFQYLQHLKKEKCSCADELTQLVLLIVASVQTAVIAVGILVVLGYAVLATKNSLKAKS
jgi:uncharacterized membrane protein YwzB